MNIELIAELSRHRNAVLNRNDKEGALESIQSAIECMTRAMYPASGAPCALSYGRAQALARDIMASTWSFDFDVIKQLYPLFPEPDAVDVHLKNALQLVSLSGSREALDFAIGVLDLGCIIRHDCNVNFMIGTNIKSDQDRVNVATITLKLLGNICNHLPAIEKPRFYGDMVANLARKACGLGQGREVARIFMQYAENMTLTSFFSSGKGSSPEAPYDYVVAFAAELDQAYLLGVHEIDPVVYHYAMLDEKTKRNLANEVWKRQTRIDIGSLPSCEGIDQDYCLRLAAEGFFRRDMSIPTMDGIRQHWIASGGQGNFSQALLRDQANSPERNCRSEKLRRIVSEYESYISLLDEGGLYVVPDDFWGCDYSLHEHLFIAPGNRIESTENRRYRFLRHTLESGHLNGLEWAVSVCKDQFRHSEMVDLLLNVESISKDKQKSIKVVVKAMTNLLSDDKISPHFSKMSLRLYKLLVAEGDEKVIKNLQNMDFEDKRIMRDLISDALGL